MGIESPKLKEGFILAKEICTLIPKIFLRMIFPAVRKPAENQRWWKKPGLAVMYQIEFRPGWEWQRDWPEFNKSMSDEKGGFKFNGPYPKTDEWVNLSSEIGLDYHSMEIKWHDGICYFNTQLTAWKTPVDYAGEFATLSRAAGIPFMYYYSTIFDHNPQFDPIQPNRHGTVSFIMEVMKKRLLGSGASVQ
jgi:hypothetical protein